jgi:superfamily II DNA or RNA helicase
MPKVILDWDTKYRKGIIISDFLDVIREHFSIENPDAHILKKKYGPRFHIDARKYAITNTGRFEPALLFDLVRYLKGSEVQYECVLTPLLENEMCLGFPDLLSRELVKLKLDPRDYQEDTILKCLKFGMGTCVVGTAGGKTLTMAILIQTLRKNRMLNFKTLVILPAQLITQTSTDFIDYGIPESDICCWGDGSELEDKPIIIASVKTLEAKLVVFKHLKPKIPVNSTDDEKRIILQLNDVKQKERRKEWMKQKRMYVDLLAKVDIMIVDEVHGLRKDNTFNKIIELFPTHHRFGFTGTMPESLLDQWNITGRIGPILKDMPSYELRDKGYISNVHATILKINYKNPPIFKIDQKVSTKAYKDECNFLYTNDYRNKVITHISNKTLNNTLILVNSLLHGETLFNLLSTKLTTKTVYYIRGEVPMDDREVIRKLMEKENNVVCIAISKIFSTGINIKNLHYIIFALTGKAKIRFLQSIGRGLRLHEFKESLEIIDIVDNVHYSLKHYEEKRLEYYEKEKIEYEIKELSE